MKRWAGGLKRKRRVFKRDNGICWKCYCQLHVLKKEKQGSSKKAHLHHLIFRCNGGTDDDENLVLTCHKCEVKTHELIVKKEKLNNYA